MASRIAGITIEIGGDTSNLQKSLKGVDSQLRSTQSALRDVNKLLKLDPGNTELLVQKQKNLESAIAQTKNRLHQLKDAQKGVEKGTQEWDNLQREIIATEQSLKGLEKEYREFGSVSAQQIKAAGQAMKDFGGKVESVGRTLAPVSAAAAGIGASMLKLGYNAVTSADELNTLSQQTGISTEELQKFKYASDLIDVSLEDMTGALRKMKPKMDENNETFAQLGVSVTNADGSMRNATDVFFDSVKALSKVANETERDQLAMALFGKSADSLAGIIDDGGDALRKYGKEAEELGVIMSQDTIDALNETNDVMDKLKANVGGSLAQLGATLATTLAPALEKVSAFIGTITEKIRNLTPQQTQTILKIVGIVAALSPLILIGSKLISGLSVVVSAIGTIVGVLGGPLTIAIAAAVAAGVLIYKNWDKIKATAQKLWQGIKTAFENIKSAVTGAWENVKTATTNAWENVKNSISNGITNAKNTVTNIANSIKTVLSNAWSSIKSKTTSAFNSIKTAITNPITQAKNTISSIVSTIRGFFPIHLGNIFTGIKLPHFNVDWGTLTAFGKTIEWPKGVTVSWYKKAMDNAVLLDGASIFGAMNGKLLGGGEAGREVIVSYDKLAKMIGGGTTNINVVVNPSAGMDERELADMVARRIQQSVNNRRAVWA